MATDDLVGDDDAIYGLREDLVDALETLGRFTAQGHIVTKVAEIVAAFLKNPKLFRVKLMNFMMMGGAGTGKTSIAEAIGDVFARAGMFVGNRLIQAGRAELVGQYEGQTVARTRNPSRPTWTMGSSSSTRPTPSPRGSTASRRATAARRPRPWWSS